MNGRPTVEEKYTKGVDVINYVVYASTTGPGNDEVLQHKLGGTTETAHVTLHPDGTVNLRIARRDMEIKHAIHSGLSDYTPAPSPGLKAFLAKVAGKI
jgi:hypothetical protein